MQLSEKSVLLVVLLLALPHSGMIYGNTVADHSSSGKQMALVSLLLKDGVERLLLGEWQQRCKTIFSEYVYLMPVFARTLIVKTCILFYCGMNTS